jgi:hypothetical protein
MLGVAALVGAVSLGCYIRKVVYLWKLCRHGTRTPGLVVDHVVVNTDKGTRWEPVIAFDEQGGRRVTSKQIVRVDDRMQIGQVVPVIYLAHNPEVMHIASPLRIVRSLLSDWLLLVMGVAFLSVAVLMAVETAQGTADISCHGVFEQLCS